MAKTFGYINQKGGVGKTTVSSLDAEYSALERGQNVLLIDFDGQCNMTMRWTGVDYTDTNDPVPPIHPDFDLNSSEDHQFFNQRSSITDIYWGKSVLTYDTYIDGSLGAGGRVDFIPCNGGHWTELLSAYSIDDYEDEQSKASKRRVLGFSVEDLINQLVYFIRDEEVQSIYDKIIIDTGPSISPLLLAVIEACDFVVTPYLPESYSYMGMVTILNRINEVNLKRTGREPVKFLGFLPNRFDSRSSIHKEQIGKAKEQFGPYHFPEGVLINQAVQIGKRAVIGEETPDSVMFLRPSHPTRKNVVEVFDYIYNSSYGTDDATFTAVSGDRTAEL